MTSAAEQQDWDSLGRGRDYYGEICEILKTGAKTTREIAAHFCEGIEDPEEDYRMRRIISSKLTRLKKGGYIVALPERQTNGKGWGMRKFTLPEVY